MNLKKGREMRKLLLSMAALPLVIGGLSVSASADGINILDNMKLKGEIRPRYENVDDGVTGHSNANAFTARTKLSVTADLLGIDGLTATIGGISVNNFGSHKYNTSIDTTVTPNTAEYMDGTKPYSIVKDPQDAMISNAAIDYTVNDTTVHVGRGQINLDNQRFIGTVGWRQLERSYDSVFVANNSIKNLSVLFARVYGYAGVGGTTTTDTNTVLLHAAYSVMPELKVTAYDYMIANTHDTYGIALTGKVKLDMAKLNYRAEYALQSDATMEKGTQTPTTGKADAYYYNLDLGANVNGILAGVNYEFMSGQSWPTDVTKDTNFGTPLATGHKFNGWADVASSANGGLKDFNVRLGYTAKGFGKLLAVYHDFTADTAAAGASDDKGTEFDAVYTNKIPGVNNLTGLLKYADFSKGKVAGTTNDVQKIWVGLDYKFALK
jgi:hypothetical protein